MTPNSPTARVSAPAWPTGTAMPTLPRPVHMVSTCTTVVELLEDVGADAIFRAHTILLDRRDSPEHGDLYLAKNRNSYATGATTREAWEELTGLDLDDAVTKGNH